MLIVVETWKAMRVDNTSESYYDVILFESTLLQQNCYNVRFALVYILHSLVPRPIPSFSMLHADIEKLGGAWGRGYILQAWSIERLM